MVFEIKKKKKNHVIYLDYWMYLTKMFMILTIELVLKYYTMPKCFQF